MGDVGVVAVIPVGMCQVSGVNMTHVPGTQCIKGEEFGYFTFLTVDGNAQTWKGIYKLDGDTLTFCRPQASGGERPKEFKSTPGVVLIVYKRAGK